MRFFKKLTKCGCISKVCILIFPSVNNVIILSLRQSEKLRHNNTSGKKAKYMPFKIEFLDGEFENSTSVKELEYRKVRSSNTSRLEAHDGFQIAYEGDFQSLYNVNF
jgi:hypothetical protein